jgi:sulfofructose kinase
LAEKRYDAICLGCCCWDLLGICEEYPQLDQKRPLREFSEQGGGMAATAAAAIAKLGGAVAFVGRIGDDEYGRKIARAFEEAGVDISWGLQVQAGARSQLAFCVAEGGTGRRAIFWRAPTTTPLTFADLDLARFAQARVVLVDGHYPAASLALARWCREQRIPVVADLEGHHQAAQELLAVVDYPIVSEEFAVQLAGTENLTAAAEQLRAAAGGLLLVTLGPRGSLAFTTAGALHQPAFVIDPVVDTTGAGDVYHGAFAYAVARGKDLLSAMRFASAAAALSCRALGGRAGLPTLGEVEALLARGEGLPPGPSPTP